ncbi:MULTISPECIES: hypothetical protein [Leptospira]|uniref:Lipoprotein n=2 Tax=Leptospira TaxID=171 RepID=A0AAW5VMC4_9LEPT|nr:MULTISPECIES: hypothetical protein [Leptospira]MCG6153800.1 hypothetical protein [Leptospira bandrabouensis]MCW7492637.1 hypothetical protein [Leptospira soteropolitanensis]MCW7500320.1 hypothetical protein [Leptospira soteropolitanensis]MCW7522645.1 hypothetical protein [Leptospira soteropolitanensis]MCW7526501.1 hypothetical protein [Leptospira soteropolitanensis]
MKWDIKIIFILSFIISNACQTLQEPPKEKNKDTTLPSHKVETKNSHLTKELRLTYHAVWVAKENFELLKSGSIFGTGNSYEIRLGEGQNILWLRLSSTDRENQSQFPYFYKEENKNPDVSYFVWGSKKCSVLVFPYRDSQLYARWEGIHNGFLLVFETITSQTTDPKELAKDLHQMVLQSLELY